MLQRRLEEKKEKRDKILAKEGEFREHVRSIREAPDVVDMSFWCKKCKVDFISKGYKVIGKMGMWPTSWYVGFCRGRHRAIKRITDKSGDDYYFFSKAITRERKERADDMLTPDNPRFKLVYPDKWRELYEKKG
jgi:hypothetical protein